MTSPLERLDKIRALLNSPVDGEREAAQAALDRAETSIPAKGTPAWEDAVLEWSARIEFCLSRLGSPSLTRAEQRTIRNFARYRGTPWSRGADALESVHRKLKTEAENSGNVITSDRG